MLSLGELVDERPLGLRLLTGADDARGRRVLGAHSSETPQPSRFLPPGWVMLTLGIGLRNRPAAQRALIAELHEAQLCALGVGVGVAFQRTPPAMVAEAKARGFPLFEIPFETPYREIVGFVNRSLLSDDVRLMHRSASMQLHLMDGLNDAEPERRVVERLGALLGATTALLGSGGEVVAATGTVPVEALWPRLRDERQPLERVLRAHSDVVSVRVTAPSQPARRLVVLRREASIPESLAAALIRCAERLLELIMVSRHAAAEDERVLRAELLRSALDPGDGARPELAARIARFGVPVDGTARVLVFAPGRAAEDDAAALRVRVEGVLDDDGVPHLVAVDGEAVVALVAADAERVRAWARALAASDEGLRVGGGRPVGSVGDVAHSRRDARLALEASRDDPVVLFEDIPLPAWLVGVAPAEDVTAKLRGVLEPLDAHPQLMETLRTYLRQDASVPAAAVALGLHHNSVRYRLSRIEQLLGRSLQRLPVLTELQLAVLAVDAARTRSPAAP